MSDTIPPYANGSADQEAAKSPVATPSPDWRRRTPALSHKNVATGELTVEVPGDYTVVQFQQRGDYTYVVLKPDPTGEGAQRAMLTKLEELNESGSELEHLEKSPLPDPAAGPIKALSDVLGAPVVGFTKSMRPTTIEARA